MEESTWIPRANHGSVFPSGVTWSLLTNHGPVFPSRGHCWPITGQYSRHVVPADQSWASIPVTWSLLTNHGSVFPSRDPCWPITGQYSRHVIPADQSQEETRENTILLDPDTGAIRRWENAITVDRHKTQQNTNIPIYQPHKTSEIWREYSYFYKYHVTGYITNLTWHIYSKNGN